MLGGPQESGLRAGTPNLLGAIGFGVAAAEVSGAIEDERARIAMLSDALLEHLTASRFPVCASTARATGASRTLST